MLYFRAHQKTHSVVERGIGQLKRRFHVLHGEIRLTPERACRVITVCAILHNLCKQRHIPQPEGYDDDDDGVENNDDDVDSAAAACGVAVHRQSGLAYRDHFTHTHFW